MLFEPERHEPVTDTEWDEGRARAAIVEIAANAEAAYTTDELWPEHPQDDTDTVGPRVSMYWGASGVAWALDRLHQRGAIDPQRDWLAETKRYLDLHMTGPEIGEPSASFMLGETGVRLIADADHDRLYDVIESNIEHEALELLWGCPGTMLPALFLAERTGEQRWRTLYARCADHLIATWNYHPAEDVWMWTQHLYGEVVRLLGSGHGFAGNVFALLRGWQLLSSAQRSIVVDRATHTLRVTAVRDGDLVNWSPHVGAARRGRDANLVQWCHGAPGMLTAMHRLPRSTELDALLGAGGELSWTAGPLSKGPGLCHGTAGNGYAFLALYERTKDERWLSHARRFAVHALEQTRAARTKHGRGRYSLWTGDLGVAIYLLDCIDGAGELPGLAYL